MIPSLLGNETLLCEFECDRCNKVFAKYENDLANYLGVLRTIQMVNGKKGIPSFKSPDSNLNAQKDNFFQIKKSVKVEFKKGYSIDRENGLNSITYTKHAFTPVNVFKCFFKMAMSIIDEDELKYYSKGMEFLTSKKLDSASTTSNIFSVFKHWLPDTNYQKPILILLKKRETNSKQITNTLILFFKNIMFQIFLPFNCNDIENCNSSSSFESPIAPPFLFSPPAKDYPIIHTQIDALMSNESKPVEETLNFMVDPEFLKNAVSIDLNNVNLRDENFDFKNIAGLYFFDSSEKFEFKIKGDINKK